GTHPFKNCSEAYAAGYANIPKDDDHYGKHLDRDSDGIGCDQPPADFVPHNHDERPATPATDTGGRPAAGQQRAGSALAEAGGPDGPRHRATEGPGRDQPPADLLPHRHGRRPATPATDTGGGSDAGEQGGGSDLAETGGSSATPYVAAGGAAVLLAGGGVLFAARRRRDPR